MKWTVRFLLFCVLGSSFGQENHSLACRIQAFSLARQMAAFKDPAVVRFGTAISHSLLNSLKNSDLLDSRVLEQLENSLKYPGSNLQVCENLKALMVKYEAYANAEHLDNFRLIEMAEPIIIDNATAYLFFATLFGQGGRAGKGGGSILEIYSRNGEEWTLESTKILEYY